MITTGQIKKLTDEIIKVIAPERIILFGSYASNTADENSDLDILVVVKKSSTLRHQRAREIRKHIWGIITEPKDILVYTEPEINNLKNVQYSFINNVLTSGKIIYDRKRKIN